MIIESEDYTACVSPDANTTWVCKSGFETILNAINSISNIKSNEKDITGLIFKTNDYRTLINENISEDVYIGLIIPDSKKRKIIEKFDDLALVKI